MLTKRIKSRLNKQKDCIDCGVTFNSPADKYVRCEPCAALHIACRDEVRAVEKKVRVILRRQKREKNRQRAAKAAVKRQKLAKERREKERAEREKVKQLQKAGLVPAPEKSAKQKAATKRWVEGGKLAAREAVNRELARRELCRRKLLPFIYRNYEDYQAGWVHQEICERLERFAEAVERGESPRLMLFMPPRHGKSMIVSEFFTSWFLGRNPDKGIIACSYAGALANDFSRLVQEKLRDPDYQHVFPGVTISKQKESVEEWKLAKDGKTTRGGYLAAGVGGPITGKGAHIGVIDDPVKNAEEADSETTRASHKRWYSSTFRTRLAPGGGILVIMTRWHEDDLAGWLLSMQESAQKEFEETGVWPDDAERWEVVSYPAIAVEDETYRKKGEPLHAERFPLRTLMQLRRTLIKRDWSALYQQTPTAEEGNYFTKNMFRYYDGSPPENLTVYAAADFAISKSDSAAYTVIYIVGLDENDNIYVLDERRGRWDGFEIARELIDVHRVWKPRFFGGERGHILMAIKPFLDRLLQEEKINDLVLEDLSPGKDDKELRARPIQGRMKQGKVFWPNSALWVDGAVNELLSFPTGLFKDRADALGWIGQMIPLMSGPRTKSHEALLKKRGWKERLKDFGRGSTKVRNPSMAA